MIDMKKKLILFLTMCIIAFSLIGCGEQTDYQESVETITSDSSGYFTIIEEWEGEDFNTYQIVYANDTKVKYLICYNICYNQKVYGITPLYNADGTLQIYND